MTTELNRAELSAEEREALEYVESVIDASPTGSRVLLVCAALRRLTALQAPVPGEGDPAGPRDDSDRRCDDCPRAERAAEFFVAAEQAALTPQERAEMERLCEQSKNDRCCPVGSEFRWLVMLARRMNAALKGAPP